MDYSKEVDQITSMLLAEKASGLSEAETAVLKDELIDKINHAIIMELPVDSLHGLQVALDSGDVQQVKSFLETNIPNLAELIKESAK